MKSIFGSKATSSTDEIPEDTKFINNLFDWKLTLLNIGDFGFQVHRIWLEDPFTGEKSCSQDGFTLLNCGEQFYVPGQEKIDLKLRYACDFTVSQLRKTIILESLHMLQRFPLQVELEPEALRIANQYATYSNLAFRFLGFRCTSHSLGPQVLLTSVFSYLVALACSRFRRDPSKQTPAQQAQGVPQQTPPRSPRKDAEWLQKSSSLLS